MTLKINIVGKEPCLETILVSSDSIYFKKYFPSLCFSVGQLKDKNLHLHLINPKKNDFETFIDLQERFQLISESILTLSYEETIIDDFKQNIKTYFACNRFLIISKLKLSKCLTVDIDSIFLKNFKYPKQDLGLFLRKEFTGNFKLYVSAGVFYFSDLAKEFVDYNYRLLLTVNKSGWWWFMDQFSLFMSYEKFQKKFDIYKFDKNFMNFEYNQDSVIFSAKGSSKDSLEFNDLLRKNSF